MEFKYIINDTWKNDVTVSKDEADAFVKDATTALLDTERIRCIDNADGTVTLTRKNAEFKSANRGYYYPPFANKFFAIMDGIANGDAGRNIMLYGACGTGKSRFVREIAEKYGFGYYSVNGGIETEISAFHGKIDVVRDGDTPITKFTKGALYNAFIHGTEVDADGNQVLYDTDGNVTTDVLKGMPKVIGKPAIFFLDEFAAVRPEVFMEVFNNALEIPKDGVRRITITEDGGRVVKSHPNMIIVVAGNTNGHGNSDDKQMMYGAQGNVHDGSTLDRFKLCYRFGYNLNAERDEMQEYLGDDYEIARLTQLRDLLRKMFAENKLEGVFSTRTIESICEVARTYRAGGIKNWMTEAIRDAAYCKVSENDKPAWRENVRIVYGDDLEKANKDEESIYYI